MNKPGAFFLLHSHIKVIFICKWWWSEFLPEFWSSDIFFFPKEKNRNFWKKNWWSFQKYFSHFSIFWSYGQVLGFFFFYQTCCCLFIVDIYHLRKKNSAIKNSWLSSLKIQKKKTLSTSATNLKAKIFKKQNFWRKNKQKI